LPNVKSEVINMSNVVDLIDKVSEIKPDVVINTVALTDVGKCEENPDLAKHINTQTAENIAIVCGRLNIKLIHISTDMLFSGDKPFITEDDDVCPINVYGKTKAEAEDVVLKNCLDSLIIRTNFFGWGTSYRKSFSDFIIYNLKEGKYISLYDNIYYTPIYIAELVKCVHELMIIKEVGIFNVVSSERISKYKFGEIIIEVFKMPSLVKYDLLDGGDCLVDRPLDMSLSNQKVEKVLFRKVCDIKEQLVDLYNDENCAVGMIV